MNKFNKSSFLTLVLVAALVTFTALWLNNKLAARTSASDFNTAPFDKQLEETEKDLRELYLSPAQDSMTVHVYDQSGELITTKTYTGEHLLHHEFVLPTKYEYLATIRNEVYVIHDLQP